MVVFRRMVKRALMDQAWEKFFAKNKKLAQKQAQSFSRQKTLNKKQIQEKAITDSYMRSSTIQETSLLKLRQFEYITAKHKNQKMDGFYKLNQLDI